MRSAAGHPGWVWQPRLRCRVDPRVWKQDVRPVEAEHSHVAVTAAGATADDQRHACSATGSRPMASADSAAAVRSRCPTLMSSGRAAVAGLDRVPRASRPATPSIDAFGGARVESVDHGPVAAYRLAPSVAGCPVRIPASRRRPRCARTRTAPGGLPSSRAMEAQSSPAITCSKIISACAGGSVRTRASARLVARCRRVR
jgi:hypothetical protein